MAGYTKQQFVEAALNEIGISGDLQQADLINGCNRLDAMMAEWDASGIHVGYPISTPAATNPAEETSVYPYAVDAVTLNLAIRLAPSFGRTPMPETKASAKSAKDVVILRMTSPATMTMPNTMPSGAGNKPQNCINGPFLTPAADGIDVADEGPLTFTP